MSDERIRNLERSVLGGDYDALERLKAEWSRRVQVALPSNLHVESFEIDGENNIITVEFYPLVLDATSQQAKQIIQNESGQQPVTIREFLT